MMKNTIIASLACAATILTTSPAWAQPAPPTISTEPTGSIRITQNLTHIDPNNHDTKPNHGAQLTLTGLDLGNKDAIIRILNTLHIDPEPLNISETKEDNLHNQNLLRALAESSHKTAQLPHDAFTLPPITITTDNNGKALFNGLEPTLYMIDYTGHDDTPIPEGFTEGIHEPAFAPLPTIIDGKPIYNITLTPQAHTITNHLDVIDKNVHNRGVIRYTGKTDIPSTPRLNRTMINIMTPGDETVPITDTIVVTTTAKDDKPITFNHDKDIIIHQEPGHTMVELNEEGMKKIRDKKPEEPLTVKWDAKLHESPDDTDANAVTTIDTIVNISNGTPETDSVINSNPATTTLFTLTIRGTNTEKPVDYTLHTCDIGGKNPSPENITVNNTSTWTIEPNATITIPGLANQQFYNNTPQKPEREYCIQQVDTPHTVTTQNSTAPHVTEFNDSTPETVNTQNTGDTKKFTDLWPVGLVSILTIGGILGWTYRDKLTDVVDIF